MKNYKLFRKLLRFSLPIAASLRMPGSAGGNFQMLPSRLYSTESKKNSPLNSRFSKLFQPLIRGFAFATKMATAPTDLCAAEIWHDRGVDCRLQPSRMASVRCSFRVYSSESVSDRNNSPSSLLSRPLKEIGWEPPFDEDRPLPTRCESFWLLLKNYLSI